MLHEVIRISGQNIIVSDTDYPLIIKVASLQSVRMQVYFIDSEDFFKRKQRFFDEEGIFFTDNDLRAIFFAKGVIETARKLSWDPDIIHCHGWISALIPLFIKTYYKDNPLFQNTKVVFSAYTDDFKDKFSNTFANKLALTGVAKEMFPHLKNPVGYDALIKTAFDFSDAGVIGHPQVKKSIKDYLDKYPRDVFVHPDTKEFVDEYDKFYETLMTKTPISF